MLLCTRSLLLFLLLFLLVVAARLVWLLLFVVLDLPNKIRNICKPLLLTLGTLLQLIDLLDDQGLDLCLHDWCLLFDDLLRLSCFVLDHTRVLPSQLPDQLLNLTFLLSLECLICNKSLDTLEQGDLDITWWLTPAIIVVHDLIVVVLNETLLL